MKIIYANIILHRKSFIVNIWWYWNLYCIYGVFDCKISSKLAHNLCKAAVLVRRCFSSTDIHRMSILQYFRCRNGLADLKGLLSACVHVFWSNSFSHPARAKWFSGTRSSIIHVAWSYTTENNFCCKRFSSNWNTKNFKVQENYCMKIMGWKKGVLDYLCKPVS